MSEEDNSWFTEKHYNFYKKKLEHLQKLRYIHSESAAYYDRLHLKIYGPSIIITSISGIGSFLSSSTLFSSNVQTGIAIGVGVLTSISAMIQSLASAVDYSTKAKIHREAGEEYDKLITRIEFEMEMPNEKEFANDLESLILDIQNKCTYAPPKHIVEGYEVYLHKRSRKLNKFNSNSKSSSYNILPLTLDDTKSTKSYSVMSINNKPETVSDMIESDLIDTNKVSINIEDVIDADETV